MHAKSIGVLVAAALVLVSCSDDDGSSTRKGETIAREEYGDKWPYSIAQGRLYCDGPGSNVVIEAGGTVYAINGRAMGNAGKRGYVIARDTIHLRDENGYLAGSSHVIIARGLEMCEY